MTPRETLLRIFSDTLEMVRGETLVQAHLEGIPQEVYVAGAGKASASMAIGVLKARKVLGGLIIDKPPRTSTHDELEAAGIKVMFGAHPVLDETSLAAGRAVATFAVQCPGPVVFCLSGGASALMEDLREGVSLTESRANAQQWLAAGLTIAEINRERRKFSTLKAGGLAELFGPASVTVLVLSDVAGDDLAIIGSGPVFRDEPLVEHRLIGNRDTLRRAAANATKALGLTPIDAPDLQGDVRQAVSEFVGSRHRLHAGQVLISVGETTVVVRGSGKGGRAQEFALYGSHFLTEGQALLCAGTDGSDGPTDAAGAIVEYSEAHVKARLPSDCPDVNGKHPAFAELVNDSTRIEPRSQPAQTAANLDLAAALQNNDAYHYLQRMNALIKTGPTGTNLNDLALLI